MSLRRFTFTFAAAGSVVCMVVLGAGSASGHIVRYETHLTAGFTEVPGPVTNPDSGAGWDLFSGRRTSSHHQCETGGTIRLYRRLPDPDPPVLVRIVTGARNGSWRYHHEDPPNGTYYARSAREVLADAGAHRHICRHAQSPDFTVTGQP